LNKNNFDIQSFIEIGKQFELTSKDNESSYLISYPHFVNHFKSKSKIEPTIIDLDTQNVGNLLVCLNKAKQGNYLVDDELAIVKQAINNSIVGGSKLLHFINPELYAIWDSRVYRNIHNAEPYSYRVNNVVAYRKYLSLIYQIINTNEIEALHKNVQNEVGYSITKARAVELVFFTLSVHID
jgi:hypothetical protein